MASLAPIIELAEKALRPGVLGVAGRQVERTAQKDLAGYFTALGKAVMKLGLEEFGAKDLANPDAIRHAVQLRVSSTIRGRSAELVSILALNIQRAMLVADKQAAVHEADAKPEGSSLDQLGLTGQEAANYAASLAGSKIKGINDTTIKQIADTVSNGIEDRVGIPGIAQAIEDLFDGMSKGRAEMIASTEVNDAMSEATLRKLRRLDVQYKQIIPSPGACPICLSIVANGPVPTDEPFVDDSGFTYERTPIHPNCRCATAGARGPE